MNCREINRKMLHYIDGELPDDEMKEFGDHLRMCNECNAMLSKYNRVYSAVNSDLVNDDYPFFFTRVEAKLQKRKEAESAPLFRVKPAYLVLAVLLPLFTGIWLGYSVYRQNSSSLVSNELIADVNNYLSTPGYSATDYYPDYEGTY